MKARIQYLKVSLFLALTPLFAAEAQVSISLLDQTYKAPIIGAHIKVSKDGEIVKAYISNKDGKVQIPDSYLPFSISVEHVSFTPLTKDISKSGTLQLYMQEATIQMEELFVTGQFEPQSIDETVFSVQSIDVERIEAQAAIDLADVLSNNLNITLRPSAAGDRTEIEMLGLDGRHIKVLIDGIPLVGVNGNGNNTDLTQINMSSIERIEIVEGPMSVNYGANATAGVINLITKKSSKTKVDANFSIQEETVGPEYGLYRGRHIQTLGVGYNINNKLYTRLDFRRNDFNGLEGRFRGFDHTKNDSLRGFEWQPKSQHFGGFSLSYKGGDGLRARYSLDFMDQVIDIANVIVFADEHPQTGIERPFSFDSRFNSRRIGHSLQLDGNLNEDFSYNLVSNYSSLHRDELLIRKRIIPGIEEEVVDEEQSSYSSATTRGTANYFMNANKLALQAGFEHTYEEILASNIEGGTRDLSNVAAFASVEWGITEKLKFRPGIRTIFNSIWTAPLIYSFHLKYQPVDKLDIRLTYGKSYRTPNLTELYFFFVDANHDVRGNENLSPEQGFGYGLDITYKNQFSNVNIRSNLKSFYNNIEDQITLATVNLLPLQFQYTNIDQYQSAGITLTNVLQYKTLGVNFGMTYVGRSNRLTSDATQPNESVGDEFLFSTEYNLNATYKVNPLNMSFSVFYKHTGAKEQVLLTGGDGELTKGLIDAFNWLDMTAQWSPTKNLEFGGGIKNVLDLTNINSSAESAGAHSAAATDRGLAYGRSYFLRVTYNITR